MRFGIRILIILTVISTIAALGLSVTNEANEVHESEKHTFRAVTFAEGFEIPWAMAFLPDGRLLVTERQGTLRIVSMDGSLSEPLEGVPPVRDRGQGGLLDVALHPDFASNGWVYLTYSDPGTTPEGEEGAFTALMRARLDGNALVDNEVLFQAAPDVYSTRGQHFGSRIVFDEEGHVFFSIGDRGRKENAQRLDVPNGKIHRLHDDGRIPEDNPFAGRPDALGSIWSYGHRNPQGIAVHPLTGEIFATEHGPRGGDELNHVRPGRNFGWPVITYGINYNGTPISDITEKEGMEQPVTHWTPSIAVCGIGFYTGDAFSGWTNDLFVTSLKFTQLHRLELGSDGVEHEEIVFEPGSRIRDVETGPDGFLYVALEGPGRIVRLVPVEEVQG